MLTAQDIPPLKGMLMHRPQFFSCIQHHVLRERVSPVGFEGGSASAADCPGADAPMWLLFGSDAGAEIVVPGFNSVATGSSLWGTCTASEKMRVSF